MPLVSYQGSEPYIFISYSHKDSERVYPIIEKMQRDGYRIWYDDNINGGSHWSKSISEHITKSSYFIAFISHNYFESKNCEAEFHWAIIANGKQSLLIYLEEVSLPEGPDMYASPIQAIYWGKNSEQRFYERLFSAENINGCCAPKSDRAGEEGPDRIPIKKKKNSQSQDNTSSNRKIVPIFILSVIAVAAISLGIYSDYSKTSDGNADSTAVEALAEINSADIDTVDTTEHSSTNSDDLEEATENNTEKEEVQEIFSENSDGLGETAESTADVEEIREIISEHNVSESKSTSGILMSDVCSSLDYASSNQHSVFYTDLQRNEIVSITFLDTVEDAPDDAWDFSEDGDGSVKGWANKNSVQHGYELYIAADGGVEAPSDCTGLFNGYTHVTSINLGTSFHTENVVSMKAMFANCISLKGTLDLSGFDTSSVTDMSEMFYLCNYLKGVDLSSFDTALVTDMHDMFNDCFTLSSLNVSSFDTTNVINMSYMFYCCNGLNNLDVRKFVTSSVTDMSYMFYHCSGVSLDNVANWDVSNVESYENFMNDENYVLLFE